MNNEYVTQSAHQYNAIKHYVVIEMDKRSKDDKCVWKFISDNIIS